MQLLGNIQDNTPVQLEDLERVCSLSHVVITTEGSLKSKRHMHEVLASYVQQILTSPVISLLDFETVWKERVLVEEEDNGWKYPEHDFPAMVELFRATQSSQVQIIYVHGLVWYFWGQLSRPDEFFVGTMDRIVKVIVSLCYVCIHVFISPHRLLQDCSSTS